MGKKIRDTKGMSTEQIETEMEILGVMLFTCQDQILMLKGVLNQEGKQKLNVWAKHGERLVQELGLNKNAEFYGLLTDPIHDQLDIIRQAILDRKKERKNEEG